jgi:hypothetical protein
MQWNDTGFGSKALFCGTKKRLREGERSLAWKVPHHNHPERGQPAMSLRQKLTIIVGASLLAAACSSPVSPKGCTDPITIGSSRCVAN